MTPTYTVRHVATLPDLHLDWNHPGWQTAETMSISLFHPNSSDHRPVVQARFLHDAKALAGIYQVQDRYIVCRLMNYQDGVCRDSCVEFFVKPKLDKGYMNFEINCGGNKLIQYIEDPTRENGVFKKMQPVAEKFGRMVRTHTSLTGPIKEELEGPVTYTVAFQIPFGVFEAYMGALGNVHGQVWRANCYKCADESSHPHWASWSPIGETLSFHQPDRFGLFRME